MSEAYKRELVFVIAGIVAAIMILEYFFGVLRGVSNQLQAWALIIQLMAIGIGAINMMRVHYRNIQRRVKGRWIFSAWFIVLFAILLILGLVKLATGEEPFFYTWSFEYIYTSLGQTLYAITGFYIFSAAYRAFRARNLDAAILLIGGVFVLLTNAPIGEVIWSGFPQGGNWLILYGQIPAMRTFIVTGTFGLLAFGFRTLLGKERGFYGEAAQQ